MNGPFDEEFLAGIGRERNDLPQRPKAQCNSKRIAEPSLRTLEGLEMEPVTSLRAKLSSCSNCNLSFSQY